MKRLVAAVLATIAGVVALVGVATPAQAASPGYVYVVVNNRVCVVPGAKVEKIQLANSTIGWSTPLDAGDNIVYPRVLLGGSNDLQIHVWCYYKGRQTGFYPMQATITPAYYNQTIWVG